MAIGNLQQLIPAIFTGPNGERLTPEQIAQRQEIAQSLIGRATDTSPDAGGWASVLNKGLLGYQSGSGRREADNAIKGNADASQSSIAAMLGGLTGGGAYPSAVAGGASPTSAAATGTPVSVPSAPEIRQGLIDRGLQPHIADAFILNFQDESGLNPGINEQNPTVPGSRGGFGLYQLTGPRRREYEAFAAQRGVPVDSSDAQLDFLMNELQGSEAGAAKSILSSPDTATAAQAIVNNFLRPAPEHRQSRAAKYARVATTPQEAIAQVAPQIENAPNSSSFADRWNAGFLPDGSNLRPFQPGEQINNQDGSYSTELSTTWQLPDGQFTNVPSLWMGYNGPVRFNPEDEQGILGAMQQYEFGRGQSFPRFLSAQEAEAAAMQRSNAGGAGADAPVNPAQPAASPAQSSLLAQNDMMLGGALSPTGASPVAQALSGYFPDAPSMQSSPQQSQAQGGINPAVIQALSDPYATPQQRQVASLLLGRQLDANDPYKQAQLAQLQAQTAQLQRGVPSANSAFGNLDAQARAAGLQPGSTEYQQFMLNGGGLPATFRALDEQAKAAGFQPGSPEYNQFMATRGAGLSAGAAQTARNEANIETGRAAAAETAGGQVEGKAEAEKRLAAPADMQAGRNALDILDQVENHPGIDIGTGWSSFGNIIPGTPGYDFQNVVKQASSGAFLSAIQQMRGMGSLSNAEGAAATAAVNRMDTATSKEAFLAAVRDYRKIVQQGMDKAQRATGGTASGNRTSTGVTWSVE